MAGVVQLTGPRAPSAGAGSAGLASVNRFGRRVGPAPTRRPLDVHSDTSILTVSVMFAANRVRCSGGRICRLRPVRQSLWRRGYRAHRHCRRAILHGFGCQLIGFDSKPNDALARQLGVRYTDIATIYRQADIITLHIPLTPTSHHLVDAAAFAQMKPGVMLVNTAEAPWWTAAR